MRLQRGRDTQVENCCLIQCICPCWVLGAGHRALTDPLLQPAAMLLDLLQLVALSR